MRTTKYVHLVLIYVVRIIILPQTILIKYVNLTRKLTNRNLNIFIVRNTFYEVRTCSTNA